MLSTHYIDPKTLQDTLVDRAERTLGEMIQDTLESFWEEPTLKGFLITNKDHKVLATLMPLSYTDLCGTVAVTILTPSFEFSIYEVKYVCEGEKYLRTDITKLN